MSLVALGAASTAAGTDDSNSVSGSAAPSSAIQPFTPKALELQPNCMKVYLEGFSDEFRSRARMGLPNCYCDPQDSDALVKLAKILQDHPKARASIGKIIKSWSDYRSHCAINQTAYAEALSDVILFLGGKISLKEASKGSFEGVCAAPNPFTTTCQTIGGTTICRSGGGGLPPSQMVCRTGEYSSTCTYTGG